MNIDIVLKILQLALSLLRILTKGGVQEDDTIALTLSQIVQIAAQAYHKHQGKPIDPSLIKFEDTLEIG